jgi:hypothetical protein
MYICSSPLWVSDQKENNTIEFVFLGAIFYFLWFLEVLDIFWELYLNPKKRKTKCQRWVGIWPAPSALWASSGPVCPAWTSSHSGRCQPTTWRSATRAPVAIAAHGPNTAGHWLATKEVARCIDASGLSTSDVRASRLARRAGWSLTGTACRWWRGSCGNARQLQQRPMAMGGHAAEWGGGGGLVLTGGRRPDQHGLAAAHTGPAAAAQTGSMRGPWHVGPSRQRQGEGEEKSGGRGPAQGKKKSAEPAGRRNFLFIQIKFKQPRTVLI